jgi:hypothetical protein
MISNRLIWFKIPAALVFVFLYSCSSKKNNGRYLDSSAVIETGVDYVFKRAQVEFATEFYTTPVKVIRSPNVPARLNFFLNGKRCELVDEKSREAYIGDLLHPIPYIDVDKLMMNKDGAVELDLKFPSIGTTFHLKIQEKQGNVLSITDMSDSQE